VEVWVEDGLRLAQLVDRVVAAERGAVLGLELLDKETEVDQAEEAQETIHMLEGLVVDIAELAVTMVALVAKDIP
jgi:hypothetical protein